MKIAYFDCFSGVSGDMCLGALVSAGVDFDRLKAELAKMPVTGYDLRCEKGKKNSISCVNIFVDLLEEEQPARGLADILQIIEGSDLPGQVKDKSKEVFMRLAAAEAAIHDTTPERIHFHEVGAVDAIVDVVDACMGFAPAGGRSNLCFSSSCRPRFYQMYAWYHSYTGTGYTADIA
ncbi:MAG: nickel insertion protein [Candidatus Syntrophopropionicum ammoniitolerans]